jgi:sugar lactone lactonase YvrE
VSFTEVDTIGVMPSDYVGTMTLESVNTVEQDYASENAFPSQGVAVLPNGDIVVCDTSYGRLHIFSADLEHKQTIGSLGAGRGRLQYPADVAVDGAGNMYVVDFFGNKVVKYAPDGSVTLEFGSEGKGAGQFEGPAGVAVTTDGSIWVADQLNNRLEQFNAVGSWVATVTGINHPAGMTAEGAVPFVVAEDGIVDTVKAGKAVRVFAAPGDGEDVVTSAADLAVDGSGNIYVADRGTGKLPVPAVKVFSSSGQYQRSFGQLPEDMNNTQDGELLSPGGVAVAADGTVYVMNSGFFRDATNPFGDGLQAKLVAYAATGGVVNVRDYDISASGRLNNPQDVAVDGKGQLWVTCSAPAVSTDGQAIAWNRGYVEVLDHSGNEVFTVMKAGSRSLLVYSVATNGAGLVYIGAQDASEGFVAVYDESGNYMRTIAASKVDEPADLEVAADGTLWVCNQGDGSVVHLASDGTELGRFPTPGMPDGLTVLPGGDLLVCVWGELSDVQQVIRYTSRGYVVTKFATAGGGRGTGQLYFPHDAAMLPDGLVLVSDAENGRFVAFRQDGSVAWTTARSWYVPGRMAWSPDGLLYVTDGFHNVVRELCYGDLPVTQGASVTARLDTVHAAVAAGTTARLQLSVRNWSARTDTFTIVPGIAGVTGWSCAASPSSVTVAAQAAVTVNVTVSVPQASPAGTTGNVSIAVQSTLDQTATTVVQASVAARTPPAVVVGGIRAVAQTGSTFTVPLRAQDVDDLYAAGCRVTYDTKTLRLVGVAAGSLLGDDVLFVEDHATAGEIHLASTLKGDAAPVSADGSIALLTFQPLAMGTTELDIDELQLFGGAEGREGRSGKARVIPIRVIAPQPQTMLVLQVGSPTMKAGGANVALDSPPVIIQSRTLVPIRAVVEALGGTVAWDASTQTVTIGLQGTVLKLVIGKSSALVNGTPAPIDPANAKVVPQIIGSRTMLPLRFVAESLGADVQWEASTQTITVTFPRP